MTTRKAPGSKRSRGALRIWTLEGQRQCPWKKFAGESPPSSLMANKEVEFHESFLPSFNCRPSRTAIGGQVTGKADAKAARSGFPDFLASVVSCILLSGKLWP